MADVDDGRRGDVRDGFRHRHPGGRCGVEQRRRRALSDGHGLAGVGLEVGAGDGGVGHRNLPRAHHLVPSDQSRHGAIADGDEEGLVSHRGELQHASGGLDGVDSAGLERPPLGREVVGAAGHPGWLAQNQRQRYVDGTVSEVGVGEHQAVVVAGMSHDRVGAALPAAEPFEHRGLRGIDGQHVALLRLVAPQLERRHAGLVVGNRAQLEVTAATAVVDQLGQGV